MEIIDNTNNGDGTCDILFQLTIEELRMLATLDMTKQDMIELAKINLEKLIVKTAQDIINESEGNEILR